VLLRSAAAGLRSSVCPKCSRSPPKAPPFPGLP